ncbi:16S/23S rRNA (cytidine-2'-O)-methyltransferase TlyA [Enhygromyxa salina]|uniref:16S/23S rRNA (Cytidine-2'-O)-methyltransferase TlyA n=1 Tax=Enhygromyxa salina TaxID=215803 RepID=A0A2S9XG82_9BACT|nr:TlyA family RNA methyltransferase [Enhygromyxa salina]PRP91884.1 16S/23S rRNA (cytidine-2'-O)-methyltransferase TlyA [Enhygromyxa salina]
MAHSRKTGGKVRLDKLLVERGLCDSRTRAQALILAGEVVVGDHAVTKPGTAVDPDAPLRLKGKDPNPYVSRGGLKLRGALDAFALEPEGAVCIDVGASTGGFTDCLLQAGAARVYAVDVGYGQLAWKLVNDARVVVMDRQNIRKLEPEQIPEPIDLAVADCSFISLTKVLPHIRPCLRPGAELVVLVKPQFEVGRELVGKGGVVRDDSARAAALASVEASARALGFAVRGHVTSPISGREGNREWLLWLRWGDE